MIGIEVSLREMLAARESRVSRQQTLLAQYKTTLICFTMNIAGPVKNNDQIRRGFLTGVSDLRFRLLAAGFSILQELDVQDVTGNEHLFVVKADPLSVKQCTTEAEDTAPLGRLFDMDVLDAAGRHIGRDELGLPDRQCLICSLPAKECSRNRTHSVRELQKKTMQLLEDAHADAEADEIAALAQRSLLYEVCITPKPGLVDCRNNGSHTDMDLFTFMNSASSLFPYFRKCALCGIRTRSMEAAETFRQIRSIGMHAESAMFQATNGVNTHKGAVFSVSILCAACGRLQESERTDPARILQECAAITRGITQSDFQNITIENAATAGQRLYAAYGITGVRGQAEEGFPAVLHYGLPILEQGLANGLDCHRAGAAALLHLMVHSVDTNLITRGSFERHNALIIELRALLEQTPFPESETVQKLDLAFIRENLSPGGSADLLALTWMLYFFSHQSGVNYV